MGFKTDGSSHASGILNEANFIERIEGTHGLKCFPSLTGYKYTVEPNIKPTAQYFMQIELLMCQIRRRKS